MLPPGVFIEGPIGGLRPIDDLPSAVPLFIGPTERGHGAPTIVESFAEYEREFGRPRPRLIADRIGPVLRSRGVEMTSRHRLADAVRLFFAHGGARCSIISTGTGDVDVTALVVNVARAVEVPEATLLVVPDAVDLAEPDYARVVQAMLAHCAAHPPLFAIIDVREGDADLAGDAARLAQNREHLGHQNLDHGAAYYPFLEAMLDHDASRAAEVVIDGAPPLPLSSVTGPSRALLAAALAQHAVVMPPSGAVAGVYATIDRASGPWTAPAGLRAPLAGLRPAIAVDDDAQRALAESSAGGKVLNVIRTWSDRGTLVWGARTLARDDDQWSYVAARRAADLLAAAIRAGTEWVVFQPNAEATWVKVRGQVEAYLQAQWQRGALIGDSAAAAYAVRCGRGSTMTVDDVLAGRLRLQLQLALSRPGELVPVELVHQLA